MKPVMTEVKKITQEMLNNCSHSPFGKVDVRKLHKNKEELSSLLTEVELIPLLTSVTGVQSLKRAG